MIIMVKKLVVSVKMKLWRVKVRGSESSHFEKKQFKVVQHILGIFPQQPPLQTRVMLI